LKTGHNLIAAVQEIELFDSCGLGVRVIRHKYRSDSLGATGALKAGGRYNIPEGLPSAFGALYVAGDIETAEIEASSIVAFDRWEKSYFMAMYKLLIADLRQSDHLSEIDFTADEQNREDCCSHSRISLNVSSTYGSSRSNLSFK
jgi:RES domain-containing protein